jgi:hypothetical protein
MGILTDDMKRVVSEQRLGFYATVCADGTPNLSPKGCTAVWDDDHLVFANLRSPQTIANLRVNPAIEVNVVDPIVRKGYRFKGTGAVVESGPAYEEGVRLFGRELQIDAQRIRAVVLIEVTEARPLISPVYDDGSTEEAITAKWKARFRDLHGPF